MGLPPCLPPSHPKTWRRAPSCRPTHPAELAPGRARARLHIIVNCAGAGSGGCGINLLRKPNPFSPAGHQN